MIDVYLDRGSPGATSADVSACAAAGDRGVLPHGPLQGAVNDESTLPCPQPGDQPLFLPPLSLAWPPHRHVQPDPCAMPLTSVMRGDGEGHVRTGTRHPRPERSALKQDFAFRGNKAPNKLRSFRDHGPSYFAG